MKATEQRDAADCRLIAKRCVTRSLMPGLLLVTACASVGAHEARDRAPSSFLVVQSDRVEDVWIYIDRGGVRGRRVGMAHGYHSDTLRLVNMDLVNRSTIGFVAIGSTSGAIERSGEATSQAGVSYQLYLGAAAGRAILTMRASPR